MPDPSVSPSDKTPPDTETSLVANRRWVRRAWLAAGFVSLAVGIVGIALPLLPTTPFVLLAALCFSRGSARWERWLLAHPRFGPMVRDWRAHRAIPLRAKQLAISMMAFSSVLSFWLMAAPWRWLPGLVCAAVAVWMWRLPNGHRGEVPSS